MESRVYSRDFFILAIMRKPLKNLGILAIGLAGMLSCNAQENAAIDISAEDMKANLEYLASDDLMGKQPVLSRIFLKKMGLSHITIPIVIILKLGT